MTEHVINLEGEGFFSRATCTGCDWRQLGHADELRRKHTREHPPQEDPPEMMIASDPVQPIVIPSMSNDSVIADLEMRTIRRVCEYIDFKRQAPLQLAVGLAEARASLLHHDDPYYSALTYTGNLAARISSLSARKREKLRHPTRQPDEAGRILGSMNS